MQTSLDSLLHERRRELDEEVAEAGPGHCLDLVFLAELRQRLHVGLPSPVASDHLWASNELEAKEKNDETTHVQVRQ